MTIVELHTFGIRVVASELREEGFIIVGATADLEASPQIIARRSCQLYFVAVRTDTYPGRGFLDGSSCLGLVAHAVEENAFPCLASLGIRNLHGTTEDDDFEDGKTLPTITDDMGQPPSADKAHTLESEGARPRSDAEIANMRAYAALLDDANEVERLTKAEVMRKLGLFSEAAALLSASYSNEFSWAVAIIRELVEQRTTVVKEMKSR